jgi:vancomycin resistance protein YoaR
MTSSNPQSFIALSLVALAVSACGPPEPTVRPTDRPIDRTANARPAVDTSGWHRIGAFSTTYRPEERERAHNIALSARALDGAILEPGKVLSFNRATGARTPARGYKVARTLDAAGSRPDVGGGVCLVSSVVHAAALSADLRIEERYPHTRTLPYTRAGLDATVDYGAKDLKIRNIHRFPVQLRVHLAGDRVIAELRGAAPLDYEVRLVTEGGDVRTDRRVLRVPEAGAGRSGHAQETYVVRTFREHVREGTTVARELLYTDGYPSQLPADESAPR